MCPSAVSAGNGAGPATPKDLELYPFHVSLVLQKAAHRSISFTHTANSVSEASSSFL